MIKNTVLNVVVDGLCTGCGTCVSFCPVNALKMVLNTDKGIFVPALDEDKCNKCSVCYKICPGHEVDFNSLNQEIFGRIPEDPYLGNYTKCYTGYSTNEKIRFNSSSGGLITQFLIFALEEGLIDGALVTRMNTKNPLLPEPFIARTPNEIIEASKSKYCPVPANIALKEILNAPESEKFAVVGLPCHIQAIRKTENQNPPLKNKIKIHIGIVCNHSPTFHATEFLLNRMALDKKQIKKLSYRGEGWPGGMRIEGNDFISEFVSQFSIKYWGMLFNSFFFPYRCTVCTDKSCKLADISFADAWTPELIKKDSTGTSMVIIRNDLENFFDAVAEKNGMVLDPIPKETAMESQQFQEVKKKVTARIRIMRFLRRSTPNYIEEKINPEISDYPSAISFYFKNSLSNSWFLVNGYVTLYGWAFKLKSKIF